MRTVKERAFSKLNLTLDLTGKEGEYHTLDSLVVTVDCCDLITLRARKDDKIFLSAQGMGSENIPVEKNNACRAARAFMEEYQTKGVDVTVQKNIPVGAGMGGSSADVAGVLRGMAKLYKIPLDHRLKAVADRLGSDTGYLLSGGFARIRGRGEQVEDLGKVPPLYFLLFLPPEGVSTAQCFARSDKLESLPPQTENTAIALLNGDYAAAGQFFSNGLYPAASELNSDIKRALEEARSFAPLGASMTGSGSAVFACFDSFELCAWAQSRYRGRFSTAIVRAVGTKRKKGWKNPFILQED